MMQCVRKYGVIGMVLSASSSKTAEFHRFTGTITVGLKSDGMTGQTTGHQRHVASPRPVATIKGDMQRFFTKLTKK